MRGKDIRNFVLGLVLMAAGTFLFVSLATHSPQEGLFPSFPRHEAIQNACGLAGAYASSLLLAGLGWVSYALCVFLIFEGAAMLSLFRVTQLSLRTAGLGVLLVSSLLLLALLSAAPDTSLTSYQPGGNAGGIVGIMLANLLYRAAGAGGASLTVCILLVLGAYLATAGRLTAAVRWLAKILSAPVVFLVRHLKKIASLIPSRKTKTDEEEDRQVAPSPSGTPPAAQKDDEEVGYERAICADRNVWTGMRKRGVRESIYPNICRTEGVRRA